MGFYFAQKGRRQCCDKVLERIGRMKEKYPLAVQYDDISATKDAATGNATAIQWQRLSPIGDTLPGVYRLRTNQEQ